MFGFREIAYLSLIYFGLIFCFIFRKRSGLFLFVYFFSVCLIETIPRFSYFDFNGVYTYGSFIYILLFAFFYVKKLPDQKYIIFALAILTCLSSTYFIINSKESFAIGLGMSMAAYYFSISLLWFMVQIRNSDSIFITEKQGFWVSAGNLVWSLFFLFRIIPMYWLDENDKEFLMMIVNIYTLSLFISYGFLMVGATRRI